MMMRLGSDERAHLDRVEQRRHKHVLGKRQGMQEIVAIRNPSRAHRWAFVALLVGNVALAGGPFLVRHAGVGPISAGFWRVALAIPFLWLLARLLRQPVHCAAPRR